MRGSALGQDGLGKPILAMASTTDKGVSKITPLLKSGKFYINEIILSSPSVSHFFNISRFFVHDTLEDPVFSF